VTDSVSNDTRKIEALPDVPAVRSEPRVVCRVRRCPRPTKEFLPINPDLFRAFEASVETGGNLARKLRQGLRLLYCDLPITCLLVVCFLIYVFGTGRSENLPDPSRGNRSVRISALAFGVVR
jgi:hypothetical protein